MRAPRRGAADSSHSVFVQVPPGVYPRLHPPAPPAPAETDMQQYFRVSPPSVHQMVVTLERAGFVRRQPRGARTIEVLIDPKHLPELI